MRVQVNVSDDLVKKIDEYAKIMGVSRSALCSVWIGQIVMCYELLSAYRGFGNGYL